MLGQVELRTAQVWLQVSPTVKKVTARVWPRNNPKEATMLKYQGALQSPFNYLKQTFTGLQPETTYDYQFFIDGMASTIAKGSFTTQPLWQWRKPAPDFSFLTGSCAYFNDPLYDRPGTPYGKDSSIFKTMAAENNSAFMLWLGDNWYTREVDYFSEWGLNYRATHDRCLPILQPFLKAMPHYAIWDDHDYGPDNSDESYVLKNASRKVFMNTWCNPTFGENGQGVYSKFTWNDVDIFLLDDRWFRSNDLTPDSVNGQVNPNKVMFGKQQVEWLKNALRHSNDNPNIRFRIIATGSQVLNPVSPSDCFRHFPAEYQEVMKFLADERINGVVFLTGDRHLSQIVKKDRPGLYPLYDVTASPLTSGSATLKETEKSNPHILLNVTGVQNYTKVDVKGEGFNRRLTFNFISKEGKTLDSWSITLKEISSK